MDWTLVEEIVQQETAYRNRQDLSAERIFQQNMKGYREEIGLKFVKKDGWMIQQKASKHLSQKGRELYSTPLSVHAGREWDLYPTLS